MDLTDNVQRMVKHRLNVFINLNYTCVIEGRQMKNGIPVGRWVQK